MWTISSTAALTGGVSGTVGLIIVSQSVVISLVGVAVAGVLLGVTLLVTALISLNRKKDKCSGFFLKW